MTSESCRLEIFSCVYRSGAPVLEEVTRIEQIVQDDEDSVDSGGDDQVVGTVRAQWHSASTTYTSV